MRAVDNCTLAPPGDNILHPSHVSVVGKQRGKHGMC